MYRCRPTDASALHAKHARNIFASFDRRGRLFQLLNRVPDFHKAGGWVGGGGGGAYATHFDATAHGFTSAYLSFAPDLCQMANQLEVTCA